MDAQLKKDACCIMLPREELILEQIERNWEMLIAQGGTVHYHEGHVLFYENHVPFGFFFLKEGEVVSSRMGLSGERMVLTSVKEGPLGLLHLVTNTTYCATATAKEDVEAIFIPKSVVLEFLKKGESL